MRFAAVLTEDAERDLDDICRFAATQDSPAAADPILSGLEAACAKPIGLPPRGNVPAELVRLGLADYREIRWKPYRIIYQIAKRRVIVRCIADGRRDLQGLLQRRLFS